MRHSQNTPLTGSQCLRQRQRSGVMARGWGWGVRILVFYLSTHTESYMRFCEPALPAQGGCSDRKV